MGFVPGTEQNMRVELKKTPEFAVEPRMWVQHEQGLVLALRPGWV
jgi:hypothetical protein